MVYVQYNRKIASRFKKRRELGKNFDPLTLEDIQWNNEWVDAERVEDMDYDFEDLTQHRIFTEDVNNIITYSRRHQSSLIDDEEVEDDYGLTSGNAVENDVLAQDEDGNDIELDEFA